MKNLLSILLLLISFYGSGQVVLIQEDVNADTVKQYEGQNLRRYNSTYTSFGLLFGNSENNGSAIIPYYSYHVQSGARLKLKINPVLSWGLDNYFDYKSFRIKQSDEKTFGGPAPSGHKKETFIVLAYDILLFTRINIDPQRGNYLGKYLDLGVYGGYNVIRRHKVVDTVNTQYGFSKGKFIATNLKYVNNWNYGVSARIGFGGMMIYCNYRLSDLFKKYATIDYMELPRFEAGLCFDVEAYRMRDNYAHRKKKKH